MKNDKVKKRAERRIYFKNRDMDFYFMCILSTEGHEGCSYGEAFHTASRIKENDPVSWSNEWIKLGSKCKAIAENCLSKNNSVSARQAFLRAYTYLRWGGHGLSVSDPARARNYYEFVKCFRQGTHLLEEIIEPIEVPWKLRGEDTFIPGYFMTPDNTGKKRPTIIIINGGEMYPEDQYFWGGAAALQRGYNVLTLTYEGQPALPIKYPEWQPIGPNAVNDLPGGPYGFMVDYALSRSETDPEKLVGLGFSGGGYHIMHQASADKRLKALVISPPITDPLAMVEAEFPKSLQKVPSSILRLFMKIGFAVNPFTKVAFEGLLSIARVNDLPEFLEMMKETRPIDPADILCPCFCAVGEGDSSIENQQADDFIRKIYTKSSVKRIFKLSDGASSHCLVDNFPLFEQEAFDWLDHIV